jgi:hypothetical protein
MNSRLIARGGMTVGVTKWWIGLGRELEDDIESLEE